MWVVWAAMAAALWACGIPDDDGKGGAATSGGTTATSNGSGAACAGGSASDGAATGGELCGGTGGGAGGGTGGGTGGDGGGTGGDGGGGGGAAGAGGWSTASSHCDNGESDGDETGIDCGGSLCPSCEGDDCDASCKEGPCASCATGWCSGEGKCTSVLSSRVIEIEGIRVQAIERYGDDVLLAGGFSGKLALGGPCGDLYSAVVEKNEASWDGFVVRLDGTTFECKSAIHLGGKHRAYRMIADVAASPDGSGSIFVTGRWNKWWTLSESNIGADLELGGPCGTKTAPANNVQPEETEGFVARLSGADLACEHVLQFGESEESERALAVGLDGDGDIWLATQSATAPLKFGCAGWNPAGKGTFGLTKLDGADLACLASGFAGMGDKSITTRATFALAGGFPFMGGHFQDNLVWDGVVIGSDLSSTALFVGRLAVGQQAAVAPEEWKVYGDDLNQRARSLAGNAGGTLVLGGDYQGVLDLGCDDTLGVADVNPTDEDAFAAAFDTQGQCLWVAGAKNEHVPLAQRVQSVAIDSKGAVFAGGAFQQDSLTDQGGFVPPGVKLPTPFDHAAFVAKLRGSDGNALWVKAAETANDFVWKGGEPDMADGAATRVVAMSSLDASPGEDDVVVVVTFKGIMQWGDGDLHAGPGVALVRLSPP